MSGPGPGHSGSRRIGSGILQTLLIAVGQAWSRSVAEIPNAEKLHFGHFRFSGFPRPKTTEWLVHKILGATLSITVYFAPRLVEYLALPFRAEPHNQFLLTKNAHSHILNP